MSQIYKDGSFFSGGGVNGLTPKKYSIYKQILKVWKKNYFNLKQNYTK